MFSIPAVKKETEQNYHGNQRPPLHFIWIKPEDDEFADRLLRENNLNPDKTVVLFAGAQHNCRVYENYGIAISKLCRKEQLSVIALGAEEDYDINQKNLDAIGVKTINLSGKTTILQSAAIVKHCRLALGAESRSDEPGPFASRGQQPGTLTNAPISRSADC